MMPTIPCTSCASIDAVPGIQPGANARSPIVCAVGVLRHLPVARIVRINPATISGDGGAR